MITGLGDSHLQGRCVSPAMGFTRKEYRISLVKAANRDGCWEARTDGSREGARPICLPS